VLVSLTVIAELVATIVPLVLTVLIDIVNVSVPSVTASAVGVIVNEPAFDVTVNDPDTAEKSAALVVVLFTVQYNVVPADTFVVVTFIVNALPSLIELDAGVTA
jgi:hypothetical protein